MIILYNVEETEQTNSCTQGENKVETLSEVRVYNVAAISR